MNANRPYYQEVAGSSSYNKHGNYLDDDENDDFFYEDSTLDGQGDSDEDTEEASESEQSNSRADEKSIELKDIVYRDSLADYKAEMQQLKDGNHPIYNQIVKSLEEEYKERLRLNIIHRDYLTECAEREYLLDKKAAVKEFEEKKADLRENLLADMEEKRKMIESDHCTMELNGENQEVKPVMTRKLRRRPNDPPPEKVEKRRKAVAIQVNYCADDKEIDSDLKMIHRGKFPTPIRKQVGSPPYIVSKVVHPQSITCNEPSIIETRIEDGKLLYEKRWYHRGQPVYVEGKDLLKFPANIVGIGTEAIIVKKATDNTKLKIILSQLSQGMIAIKRRAS